MAIDLSAPFIRRPVATALIALGIALFGILAYRMLPVASLPQVEFPTIAVTANLPGADPDTVASAVATPLEKQFSSIAGITDMTSVSYTGSARIVIQFDLDRDVDGAARDIQAAINAALSKLPDDLNGVPTYRKVNPAEAPVMALALTSDTDSIPALYDAASTLLQQKLLQSEGVGDVQVGGGALPAVRVDLDSQRMAAHGIGLAQVRQLLRGANVRGAKGNVEVGDTDYALTAADGLRGAASYAPLVLRDNAGAVTRLSDLATVTDSTENIRSFGLMNGKPGVALIISKRPGANVVETVDAIRAQLPQLQAAVPATMHLDVLLDRTHTIRASLHEVELTLVVSIILVIAVTAAFFRDWRATLVPAVAVPLSLLGTFAVMWALGYSLNILSLMALVVAAGFVVDDAIVVVENIMRHLQMGKSRVQAALDGAREVGFTVFSISISLVAVFIPLLMMSGLVGRLFREFSVTLAAAVLVSMLVSLTITPMMSRMLLRPGDGKAHQHHGAAEDGWYARSLRWVLGRPRLMAWMTAGVVVLGLAVFVVMPKGFFPQQDTGLLLGQVYGPENVSYAQMRTRFTDVVTRLRKNPSVDQVIGVIGTTGGASSNAGALYVTLKPLNDPRKDSADQVVAQLRETFKNEAGMQVILQPVQDIGVGGRQSAGQYQYTLSSDNLAALAEVAPRVEQALRRLPQLTDVSSDLLDGGLKASIEVDRIAAARLGLSAEAIDQALYDAFGQRQVSTIYSEMNQYHVVMGLAPSQAGDPRTLQQLYVPSAHENGGLMPLSAVARWTTRAASISQAHQGQFPAVTLSYNLTPGTSLGPATRALEQAIDALQLDSGITAQAAGNAKAFADTVRTMPLLILTALLAVYIVLGMLYESLRHPLTILSTLPSAGIGALIALAVCGFEFSIIALIGVILLIGIVKKNAILMIDFALQVEREEDLTPQEAILRASLVRFRPIMMTTLAAVLGAVPLVIGSGYGSEFRQPLGVAIIGGLMLSQLLTLYSTPAIYVLMDRFGRTKPNRNPT